MNLLRRIRGAVGNGVVWAGAWIVAKVALLGAAAVAFGFTPPWAVWPSVVGSAAATGFISGVLFSGALALVNRRRSLSEIRPFRAGLIGLAAGTTPPVVQLAMAAALGFALPPSAIALSLGIGLVVGGGLGAATAVGSLRLAQSAERKELSGGEPLGLNS